MKRIAIYAGSFDPITNGHLSIIRRGVALFDQLWVMVTNNPAKKYLFDLNNRMGLVAESIELNGIQRTFTNCFENRLLVEVAREKKATALLRGLRAVSDFEAEFQMAQANHSLAPEIETVFVMTQDDYFFVSSSMVREIASLRGDVSKFVPPGVEVALKGKFQDVSLTR